MPRNPKIAEADWTLENLRVWAKECSKRMREAPASFFALRAIFLYIVGEYESHSDRHVSAKMWDRIHAKLRPDVLKLLQRPTSLTRLNKVIETYYWVWK